jgi:hypothetical protein
VAEIADLIRAIGIEEHDAVGGRLLLGDKCQPAQAGCAVAALALFDDDGAGRLGHHRGTVRRAVVDDDDVAQGLARPLPPADKGAHDLPDRRLFVEGRDDDVDDEPIAI